MCGQLDAVGEPSAKIVRKDNRAFAATVADEERDDQLRIGVNCGPSPTVARAFGGSFSGGDNLFLGVAERPYLVALDAPHSDVAHRLVVDG